MSLLTLPQVLSFLVFLSNKYNEEHSVSRQSQTSPKFYSAVQVELPIGYRSIGSFSGADDNLYNRGTAVHTGASFGAFPPSPESTRPDRNIEFSRGELQFRCHVLLPNVVRNSRLDQCQ